MKKILFSLMVSITCLLSDTHNQIADFIQNLENKKNDLDLKNFQNNGYFLEKGWNKVIVSDEGIDVVKTFANYEKISVFIYDNIYKVWAIFLSEMSIQKQISSFRALKLKSIEPNQVFYVYTQKDTDLKVISEKINGICQKIINSKKYNILEDSFFTPEADFLLDEQISIQSKYFSHHIKGVYSDTRVALIYPKIGFTKKEKHYFKYGSALPKVFLQYNEEYADKEFYIYSYFDDSCYKGIFPSKKTPPFSTLLKLKEER